MVVDSWDVGVGTPTYALPASELESTVTDQLRTILRSPQLLDDVIEKAKELDADLDSAKVTVAMTQLERIWDQLFPAEQARITKLLIEKVIVSPNNLEVRLRANGFDTLITQINPTTSKCSGQTDTVGRDSL